MVATGIALFLAAAAASAPQSGGGFGYGGANGRPAGQQADTMAGSPPGVGYNQGGGEVSAQASEAAALTGEFHVHMVGTTAAQAVGSGGGPAITNGRNPGYVQAKYVTPTGNAVTMHHYGPGYPPPLGQGGPNDGNPGMASTGTVAGNPGLVNWGLMPAWDREELGNGAWVGNPTGNSPMPYIGGFND